MKEFLNSEDGKAVQKIAKTFSEAYLSGDRSVMETQVLYPQDIEAKALKDLYSLTDLTLRTLKVDPDRLTADSVSAQYEVRIAGDPAYKYVELQLVKSEKG